jgi:hypothetical protein
MGNLNPGTWLRFSKVNKPGFCRRFIGIQQHLDARLELLAGMHCHNQGNLSGAQFYQGTRWVNSNHANKGFDHFRIKLGAAVLKKHTDGVGGWHTVTIATVTGHGIEGIHNGYDPGEAADLPVFKLVRITPAVYSFVMMAADVADDGVQRRVRLHQFVPEVSMIFHDSEFFAIQRAWLVQDVVRHVQLAQVMKQAAHTRYMQVFIGEPQKTGEGDGENGNPQAVLGGIGITGFHPAHPEHGTGVGLDALHALDDNGPGLFKANIVPFFDCPGEVVDQVLGIEPDLAGSGDFLGEGPGFRQWLNGAFLQFSGFVESIRQCLNVVLDDDPLAVLAK